MSLDNDQLILSLSEEFGIAQDKLKGIDIEVSKLLRDKIKEINDLKADNLKLTTSIDEIKATASSRVTDLDTKVKSLNDSDISVPVKELEYKNEIDNLRKQISDDKAEMMKDSLKITSLTNEKENTEKQLLSLQQTINDQSVVNRELETLQSNEKDQLSNLKIQFFELSGKVDALIEEKQYTSLEIERKSKEIELTNRHKSWLENELEKRTNELISFKENYNDEIHKLNYNLSDIVDENKLLKSTEELLRDKNKSLASDLQEHLEELKKVKDTLNKKESEFTKEMSINDKMKKLLEDQVRALQVEMKKNLESKYSHESEFERERLINDLAITRNDLNETKQKCTHLQTIIDDYIGDDKHETDTFESNMNPKGIIMSHPDFKILKKQLIKEKSQKELLKSQVEAFVTEVESRVPLIDSFKQRTEALETQLQGSMELVDKLVKENTNTKSELTSVRRKQTDKEFAIKKLRIQRSDLARQVQFLLLITSQLDTKHSLLSADEIQFIKKIVMNENNNDYNDTQSVITNRLVEFRSIEELQNKNMELLTGIRSLANQLESFENNQNISSEKRTIQEAKDAIIDLQAYSSSLELKNSQLSKERDTFKLLSAQIDETSKNHDLSEDSTQDEIIILKREMAKKDLVNDREILSLKSIVTQKESQYNDLKMKLEESLNKHSTLEDKLKILKNDMILIDEAKVEITSRLERTQNRLTEYELHRTDLLNRSIELESQVQTLKINNNKIENEKNILQANNSSIEQELFRAYEERNSLRIQVAELGNSYDKMENPSVSYQDQYQDAEEEVKKLSSELVAQNSILEELEKARNTEINWYQDELTSANNRYLEAYKKAIDLTNANDGLRKDNAKLELHVKNLVGVHDQSNSSQKIYDNIEASHKEYIDDNSISLQELKAENGRFKILLDKSKTETKSITDRFENIEKELRKKVSDLMAEKKELEVSLSFMKDRPDSLNKLSDNKQNNTEKYTGQLHPNAAPSDEEKEDINKIRSSFNSQIMDLQNELEKQKASYDNLKIIHEKSIGDVGSSLAKTSYVSIGTQLTKSANNIDYTHIKELIQANSELEESLSFANQTVENLSTQNELLFDKLANMEHNGNDDPNTSIVSCLKLERDNLQKNLNMLERKLSLITQTTALNANKLKSQNNSLYDVPTNVTEDHSVLLEKINELNIMEQNNKMLENEIHNLKTQNSIAINKTKEMESQVKPLKNEIEILKTSVLNKEHNISLVKEESNRWKSHSLQISQEQSKLLNQIGLLDAQLKEKEDENVEVNDKFNRLKKQAHDRLDATKATISQLNDEINTLRKERDSLESHLNDVNYELQKTKSELSDMTNDRSEENTSFGYKQIATGIQNEINVLKTKLEAIDESTKSNDLIDYISQLNNIREQFAKECIEFENNLKNQLSNNNENVNEMSLINKSNDVVIGSNSEQLEEAKRKWYSEWEEETNRRIEEAKDDLKKHLRLPSEEKINRVIEKRKQELEEEFEEKLEEKAKLLLLSNEYDLTPEQVKDQIEKEAEANLLEQLEEIRKKSFEEGRQQESMKTKLLERKLSKLESSQNNVSDIKTPNEANLSQDQGMKKQTTLERNSKAATPNPFGSQSENPFTVSPSSQSITSSAFPSMKPTFSFGNITNNNSKPIFGTISEPFKHTELNNTFSVSKERSDTSVSTDNKRKPNEDDSLDLSYNSTADKDTEKGENSPLKKPKI